MEVDSAILGSSIHERCFRFARLTFLRGRLIAVMGPLGPRNGGTGRSLGIRAASQAEDEGPHVPSFCNNLLSRVPETEVRHLTHLYVQKVA
jgi:hypothetical protein